MRHRISFFEEVVEPIPMLLQVRSRLLVQRH